jgi:intergrase/recombinase
MKAKTVKEVLVATKWILSHYEWHQGSYTANDANGKPFSFCLVGAMQRVETEKLDLMAQAYKFMADEVQPHQEMILSVWNDMPGRTKTEVLSLLDRVIEKAPHEIYYH